MTRSRLLLLAAVAGLGFAAGCQSSSCGGGMMSRLSSRRGTVIYDGPVIGTPVSSMPYGDYCEGGPALGAPGMFNPPMGGPTTIPTAPPGTMLPSPTPSTGSPPLAPVPPAGSPGFATPTPAQPSLRRR